MKIVLFSAVLVSATMAVQAQARDAEEIYNKACVACHAGGVSGAPKTGDAADWKDHLAKGMPTLLNNAKNGIGAMPPKGLCMDCTDDEFKALIKFMSTSK